MTLQIEEALAVAFVLNQNERNSREDIVNTYVPRCNSATVRHGEMHICTQIQGVCMCIPIS